MINRMTYRCANCGKVFESSRTDAKTDPDTVLVCDTCYWQARREQWRIDWAAYWRAFWRRWWPF